jgi:antirestriction protein ArdC
MKNTAEYHDYLDGLQYDNPPVTADSVYKEVCDLLIKDVEEGKDTNWDLWRKSKETRHPQSPNTLPINFVTRKRYTGGNIFALLLHTQAGYTNEWLTAAQCKKAGGRIAAGEKPTRVVFVKVEEDEEPDQNQPTTNEPERKAIVRAYRVYNFAQCEGLTRKGAADAADDTPAAPVQEQEDGRIPTIDKMIAATGADITYKGEKAFYSLTFDCIVLPPFNQFHTPQGFYAVSFHELGHWTGAPHRLNRTYGKRFGDAAYAFEELVAESCSALCMFSLNLPMIKTNGAYLRNWLQKVTDPKKRSEQLWRAFGLADRAYRAILPEFAGGKQAKKAQEQLTKMTDFVVEHQNQYGVHVRLPVKAPANRKWAVYAAVYDKSPIIHNILEWRVMRTFENELAAFRYKMDLPAKAEEWTKKQPRYLGLPQVCKLTKV